MTSLMGSIVPSDGYDTTRIRWTDRGRPSPIRGYADGRRADECRGVGPQWPAATLLRRAMLGWRLPCSAPARMVDLRYGGPRKPGSRRMTVPSNSTATASRRTNGLQVTQAHLREGRRPLGTQGREGSLRPRGPPTGARPPETAGARRSVASTTTDTRGRSPTERARELGVTGRSKMDKLDLALARSLQRVRDVAATRVDPRGREHGQVAEDANRK